MALPRDSAGCTRSPTHGPASSRACVYHGDVCILGVLHTPCLLPHSPKQIEVAGKRPGLRGWTARWHRDPFECMSTCGGWCRGMYRHTMLLMHAVGCRGLRGVPTPGATFKTIYAMLQCGLL